MRYLNLFVYTVLMAVIFSCSSEKEIDVQKNGGGEIVLRFDVNEYIKSLVPSALHDKDFLESLKISSDSNNLSSFVSTLKKRSNKPLLDYFKDALEKNNASDTEVVASIKSKLDSCYLSTRITLYKRLAKLNQYNSISKDLKTYKYRVQLGNIFDEEKITKIARKISINVNLKFMDLYTTKEILNISRNLDTSLKENEEDSVLIKQEERDDIIADDELLFDEKDTKENYIKTNKLGIFRYFTIPQGNGGYCEFHLISSKDSLIQMIDKAKMDGVFPKYIQLIFHKDKPTGEPSKKFYFAKSKELLNANHIQSARKEFSPYGGREIISMQFNREGTEKWARITEKFAKTQRAIGIVYMNELLSAPIVNSKITSGASQIAGNFDPAELDMLVTVLSNGGIDAEIEIENVNVYPKK